MSGIGRSARGPGSRLAQASLFGALAFLLMASSGGVGLPTHILPASRSGSGAFFPSSELNRDVRGLTAPTRDRPSLQGSFGLEIQGTLSGSLTGGSIVTNSGTVRVGAVDFSIQPSAYAGGCGSPDTICVGGGLVTSSDVNLNGSDVLGLAGCSSQVNASSLKVHLYPSEPPVCGGSTTITQNGAVLTCINATGTLTVSGSAVSFVANGTAQCGGTSAPTILHEVPITITNNQSTPTPAPFQVMIRWDAAAYSSWEAPGLQNVEFLDSSGHVIPSWLESGNSSSSPDSIFWVLLANGIPAESSTFVYMAFASPQANLLNRQTTGEDPQLSTGGNPSDYGIYDDGSAVFSTYENFANVDPNPPNNGVPPAGWYTSGTDTGCSYIFANARNGYDVAGVNGCGTVYLGSDIAIGRGTVVDLQIAYLQTTGSDWQAPLVLSNSPTSFEPSTNFSVEWNDNGAACNTADAGASLAVTKGPGGPVNVTMPNSFPPLVLSASPDFVEVNYSEVAQPGSIPFGFHGYLALAAFTSSYCGSEFRGSWIRTRALPPNGVMPQAFAGDYPLSFRESGLPSDTPWSVTIAGGGQSSRGPAILLAEPNGTYPFTVQAPAGYVANVTTGSVAIQGDARSVDIGFNPSAPPPPPPPTPGPSASSPSPWGPLAWVAVGGAIAVAAALVAVFLLLRRRRTH